MKCDNNKKNIFLSERKIEVKCNLNNDNEKKCIFCEKHMTFGLSWIKLETKMKMMDLRFRYSCGKTKGEILS